VLAITGDADTLFVEGDGGAEAGGTADAAFLIGDWTVGPTVDGFASFTLASATVNIDLDMTTEIVVA
jgi:hypothetical protein